jgi:putative membrane protein
MLVFWGLVILGIVLLVRALGGGSDAGDRKDPLRLLQRRLAEGDISVEEYERRRALLEKH